MVNYENGKIYKIVDNTNGNMNVGVSLVELEPLTGRTHQLRLHLSAAGYPILGDSLYAPAAVYGVSKRLCLHALSVQCVHPVTLEEMTFTAPINDWSV
jgi:tRNA pseudouridine32 synthase/23S rRNA pseudouridine746 synthase